MCNENNEENEKNDYPSKKFWQKERVYKAALKQGCQWIQWCSRYGFYSKQKYLYPDAWADQRSQDGYGS